MLVRVAGVGPGGLELEVQLSVHNPNSFPLAAEAVSGTLFVQERQLGRGSATPREPLAARGTTLVDSRLQVPWADLSAIAPLLVSERLPYEFRGDVTIGGKRLQVALPFTLAGEITRDQLLRAGLRGF